MSILMLALHSMAEDNTIGILHALDVSGPIQLTAAVIVSSFHFIASPASPIIIAMNHYTVLRYSFNYTTVISLPTELMLT